MTDTELANLRRTRDADIRAQLIEVSVYRHQCILFPECASGVNVVAS